MSKWIIGCAVVGSVLGLGCGEDADGANGGDCAAFKACGGDVVGKWKIEDICFDDATATLGKSFDEPECRDAFRNVETDFTGSLEFTSDGKFNSKSSLTLSVRLVLSASCLEAIAEGATRDLASICQAIEESYADDDTIQSGTCSAQGGGCACNLEFAPMMDMGSDTYIVSGNSFSDGEEETPFCIEGNQMTIRVEGGDSGLDGQVVLSRESSFAEL